MSASVLSGGQKVIVSSDFMDNNLYAFTEETTADGSASVFSGSNQ